MEGLPNLGAPSTARANIWLVISPTNMSPASRRLHLLLAGDGLLQSEIGSDVSSPSLFVHASSRVVRRAFGKAERKFMGHRAQRRWNIHPLRADFSGLETD